MLQNIREKTNTWIAWVIVIIICLSFALWGVESYFMSSKQGDEAALINGEPIYINQVNHAYERARHRMQVQLGPQFNLSTSEELLLKKQALESLIENTVLTQAAIKAGYQVSQEAIRAIIMSIPTFQSNGRFSENRFREVVGNMMYSEAGFINEMKSNMLINQLRMGIESSAFALSQEVQRFIELLRQSREIKYTVIPVSHFYNEIKIDETAQKKFYNEHPSLFQEPEKVSIEYLELSASELLKTDLITEDDLQHFYQENINDFKIPNQYKLETVFYPKDVEQNPTTAENILKTIRESWVKNDNISFNHALSADSSVKYTHTGKWMTAKEIPSKLLDEVLKMKSNDVSSVLSMDDGWYLIKLLEFHPEKVKKFSEVKSQIQTLLAQQKAEQKFADMSDQLSDLTFSNPDSLDVAAQQLKLTKKKTDWFTKSGLKEGVASHSNVIDAAFNTDVLQNHTNSELLIIAPGDAIVLRVSEHTKPTLKPFDSVKDSIDQLLKQSLAKEKTKEFGENLLKQTNSDRNWVALAHYNIPTKIEVISRNSNRIDSMIRNHVFEMQKPHGVHGSISGFTLPNGDYVLLELLRIIHSDFSSIPEIEKNALSQELAQNKGALEYELYVKQQMKNAKIVRNKESIHEQPSTESD